MKAAVRLDENDMMTIVNKVIMTFAMMSAIVFSVCASDSMAGASTSCSEASQSRLVMSDKSNATDILVLRITVDDLISSNMSEWPYLREPFHDGHAQDKTRGSKRGGVKSTCADGGRGGYVLSLHPDPGFGVYVIGTSIVFKVSCSGRLDGVGNLECGSLMPLWKGAA